MTKIEKSKRWVLLQHHIETIRTYSRSQIEVGEKVIPDLLNKHIVGIVLEDRHINSWSTHKEVAPREDTISGRDVLPEQGVIGVNIQKQHVPLVD